MNNSHKITEKSSTGISIVVPVYNGEKYIRSCLEMLLIQKGNFEVIVINDGSTDKTHQIVADYLTDKRIRYYSGPNRGVSAARNKGIELSKKEWVIFCDVDDEISPGYVLDAMDVISRYENLDYFCYGRFHLRTKDKTEIEAFDSPVINIKMIISGKGIQKSSDYYMNGVWSKVFNKDFLINNRIFFNEELTFAEDTLFMLSAAVNASKVVYIHRGYYRYVQNDDSICHTAGNEKDYKGYITFVNETERIKHNNIKFWKDRELQKDYNIYMNRYGMFALGRIRSGTKDLKFKDRRSMIQKVGLLIDNYKSKTFTPKDRIKRYIVRCFPTVYIFIGDLELSL